MGVQHPGEGMNVAALMRMVRREALAALSNSSIGRAGLRFYEGGRARFFDGGGIEINGDGFIDGSGSFRWRGTLDQDGATTLNGPVSITGEDGTLDVAAETLLRGLVKLLNDLLVDAGGKITVGGSQPIVLQSVGGRATIQVGDGFVRGEAGGIAIAVSGGGGVSATPAGASLVRGAYGVAALADGVYLAGTEEVSSAVGVKILAETADGRIVRLAAGASSGGDDEAPGDNPSGYIWPVNPATYGITDTFAGHVGRGSAEPGVDIGCGTGTAVYAPGAGTVVAVQTAPSGATGRYVTFVTDAGDWFRFLHLSNVLITSGHVGQGAMLARSGGSGWGRENGYGAHLHLTFAHGYTGLFPGASGTDDFQAYMA